MNCKECPMRAAVERVRDDLATDAGNFLALLEARNVLIENAGNWMQAHADSLTAALAAAPEPTESYPEPWIHATIHLNPDTGEMHSDGNHAVRTWIEKRIDATPPEPHVPVSKLETLIKQFDGWTRVPIPELRKLINRYRATPPDPVEPIISMSCLFCGGLFDMYWDREAMRWGIHVDGSKQPTPQSAHRCDTCAHYSTCMHINALEIIEDLDQSELSIGIDPDNTIMVIVASCMYYKVRPDCAPPDVQPAPKCRTCGDEQEIDIGSMTLPHIIPCPVCGGKPDPPPTTERKVSPDALARWFLQCPKLTKLLAYTIAGMHDDEVRAWELAQQGGEASE